MFGGYAACAFANHALSSFNYVPNTKSRTLPYLHINRFRSYLRDQTSMTTNPDNQKPVEEPSDVEVAAPATETSTFSAITQRWKREDTIKKASPITRGISLLFSLLAFLIMVSNKHGPGRNFDDYEEYRYLVAISIFSTLYTAWQTFVYLSKREFFDRRTSILVGFSGDQIVAYLLISAASSAIPLTNRFREGQDNIFTDSAASAIAMAVLAFVSLAISALFSGYKLSTHSFV